MLHPYRYLWQPAPVVWLLSPALKRFAAVLHLVPSPILAALVSPWYVAECLGIFHDASSSQVRWLVSLVLLPRSPMLTFFVTALVLLCVFQRRLLLLVSASIRSAYQVHA